MVATGPRLMGGHTATLITMHSIARRTTEPFLLAAVLALVGCDQSPRTKSGPTAPAAESAKPSPWRHVEGSQIQGIGPNEEFDALDEAIATARRTAPQARQRWLKADAAQREHWAIKWAAPTAAGGVEHVWVRPMNWSEFRIEGILDSPPQNELDCGRTMGQLVSFPIEELSDWLYVPGGDFANATGSDPPSSREGGFTIAPLDRR